MNHNQLSISVSIKGCGQLIIASAESTCGEVYRDLENLVARAVLDLAKNLRVQNSAAPLPFATAGEHNE